MEHFIAIAFKNVFRQKKRSFTLGVNYAIVTLILTLLFAFSQGAKVNIYDSLTKATAGHITISGRYATGGKVFAGILRSSDIEKIARDSLGQDARIVTRYQVQSALFYNGLSKRLGFQGIDTEKDTGFRDQMRFLSGSWDDYASDPNGLLVPKDIADYFGFASGEEVVISSRTRFGAFNTGLLKIRGIYETDNYFARGLMLTHFDFLRSLDLAEAGSSTSIYVYFDSLDGIGAKRDTLVEALIGAGFEATIPKSDSEAIAAVSSASTKYEADKEGRDRIMLNLATIDEALGIVSSLLTAVNAAGALIAAVMLFVIAVSIFINLKMSINERLREIGTLRAMGVESGGVTSLFIFESVILALIFSSLGALLAVIISALFRYLIVLPAGGEIGLFLNAGHLVLVPTLGAIVGTVAVIALFATIFSFFPARKGGAIPPVEALTRVF